MWVTGGVPVTHLRKMMLEELQRLNYAQNTTRSYIRTVEEFARPLQLPTGSPGPAAYSRIPSDAVSQTEVVTGKRRCPSGCLEVLLLQDTQAGLEHHRHSLSEKGPSPATDPQQARSRALDQCGQHDLPSHSADDPLRYRRQERRSDALKVPRLRQAADGRSHPRRQGTQRPRRHAQLQTARRTS